MAKYRMIVILLFLLLTILTVNVYAFYPNYRLHSSYLLAPSASFQKGLLGYSNPALTSTLTQNETIVRWASDPATSRTIEHWGLFSGFSHVGFGVINSPVVLDSQQKTMRDYRFHVGFGDPAFSFGLGYGWQSGLGRSARFFNCGSIFRPNPMLSIGITASTSTSGSQWLGRVSLAVRPLKSDRLTVFSEVAREHEYKNDTFWNIGSAVQLFPGLMLTGRYFDNETVDFGLEWSFGFSNLLAKVTTPSGDDKAKMLYGIRIGGNEYNVFDEHFARETKYVTYELRQGVQYRKYKYFSTNKYTLWGLLNSLDDVISDPALAGVALNLSDMRITAEMAWEVREKLKNIQAAGKRVIVYFNNAGMTTYHLASVADRVVMDPIGVIQLNGFMMGRTYYRNLLAKMGIGFQEWRLFTHKSANETFSRTDMSGADREQRQALVEDRYRIVRSEICESRNLKSVIFDSLINQHYLINPTEALKFGLVDTLSRWTSLDNIIRGLEGEQKQLLSSDMLAMRKIASRQWGRKPRIAVVYALGICATETGIRARRLEHLIMKLAKSRSIDAVILRIDSPGGDSFASDIVAEAMKKCAKKKPVLVSQGYVAASGGYWISMNADTIVSSPFTITGSIGVIGGWLWNDGLGEKLGITTDLVKMGEHADLGFGMQLPLIGVPVPERNLTEFEQQKVEAMIREYYNIFVDKVAKARGQTDEYIRSVAEGRVWSGVDAQDKGLVDVIGGLETTIVLAKEAIGLNPEDGIEVVEFPQMAQFNRSAMMPTLIKTNSPSKSISYEIEYLDLIHKFPGQPLPVIAPDLMSEEKNAAW